ncbi:hypothetical protein Syun_029177 [Stephania yunnanensis]|uniref:Uncharacterized protein n=1 Tax=Stephania yunnanensis TaxID=152371 RepID=A0AAP0ECR3_9MAGN
MEELLEIITWAQLESHSKPVPYLIDVCATHGVRVHRDVGICYLTLSELTHKIKDT